MDVFERIAGIIFPVFIIIALGYAYARFRGATVRDDMAAVNRVSMDVLCPLLVFTALAAKDFDLAQNGTLMLAMIIGMGFALAKISLPHQLFQALTMLGDACIPIMLFALGVRMLDVSLKSWHIGLIGAIVCPLAGLAVAWMLDNVLRLN